MEKLAPHVFCFKLTGIRSYNYRDVFYTLTEAVIETFFEQERVVSTTFTDDWLDKAHYRLLSYSVMVITENGHFCCHYNHQTKQMEAIFWTNNIRVADKALVNMLFEKRLGKCRHLPVQHSDTLSRVSIVLPQAPDVESKTEGSNLAKALEFNPVAICSLREELPISRHETYDDNADYILFTDQGYIIRHIEYGEILLTVFVWEEFDTDKLLKIVPEYAWYDSLE